MNMLKLNMYKTGNRVDFTIESNIITSKLELELIKRLVCLQFPFIYKKYEKNKELQNCFVSFSPMYVESGGVRVLTFEPLMGIDHFVISSKYADDIVNDIQKYLNDVLIQYIKI